MDSHNSENLREKPPDMSNIKSCQMMQTAIDKLTSFYWHLGLSQNCSMDIYIYILIEPKA